MALFLFSGENMCDVKSAIEDIALGKIVIVVDSDLRENEGDFICSAQLATKESVNFMITHGRGLICCALGEKRAKQLNLPLMVAENTCPLKTAFTVSVDAKKGLTTGICTQERACTINTLASSEATEDDFVRPGHIFPLIASGGGVLERAGHTEAGIELVKVAGLDPSAMICEILNADGTMARLPQLRKIAKLHKLKIVKINDIIAYVKKIRRRYE